MTISELHAKLIEAGYVAYRFAIGDESGGCSDCSTKDDAYCLIKRQGTWSTTDGSPHPDFVSQTPTAEFVDDVGDRTTCNVQAARTLGSRHTGAFLEVA